MKQWIADTHQEHGRIDILINNAAYIRWADVEETTVEEAERTMRVGYDAMVHTIKTVLPLMQDSRSGHIVNIGSSAGKVFVKGPSAAYAAMKAAVEGYTRILQLELSGTPVHAMLVRPGVVVGTDFFHHHVPPSRLPASPTSCPPPAPNRSPTPSSPACDRAAPRRHPRLPANAVPRIRPRPRHLQPPQQRTRQRPGRLHHTPHTPTPLRAQAGRAPQRRTASAGRRRSPTSLRRRHGRHHPTPGPRDPHPHRRTKHPVLRPPAHPHAPDHRPQDRTAPPHPLLYATEPTGDLLVVASNFGHPRHPAWSTNLIAHPHATVTRDGRATPVTGHLLTGDDRDHAWQQLLTVWPAYATYAHRSGRPLRIFRLSPNHTT